MSSCCQDKMSIFTESLFINADLQTHQTCLVLLLGFFLYILFEIVGFLYIQRGHFVTNCYLAIQFNIYNINLDADNLSVLLNLYILQKNIVNFNRIK